MHKGMYYIKDYYCSFVFVLCVTYFNVAFPNLPPLS